MEKNNIDYEQLAQDLAYAINVNLPTAKLIIERAKTGNFDILKYYGFNDLDNLKQRVGGISRNAFR